MEDSGWGDQGPSYNGGDGELTVDWAWYVGPSVGLKGLRAGERTVLGLKRSTGYGYHEAREQQPRTFEGCRR